MLAAVANMVFKLSVAVLVALVIVYSAAGRYFPEVVALVWFASGAVCVSRGEPRVFIGTALLSIGVMGFAGASGRQLVTFATIFIAGVGVSMLARSDLRRLAGE
jgi:hypothetical protein